MGVKMTPSEWLNAVVPLVANLLVAVAALVVSAAVVLKVSASKPPVPVSAVIAALCVPGVAA